MRLIALAVASCLVLASVLPRAARADDPVDPILAGLQLQWYGVQATLQGSIGNESMLEGAYLSFENWAVQARGYPQLIGYVSLGQSLLAQNVSADVSLAHSACSANNDPTQIAKIARLIDWATNQPDVMLAPGFSLAELNEHLQKCAHFDLVFQSEIDAQGGISVAVQSHFALETLANGTHVSFLPTAGALDYTHVTWPSGQGGCTITGTGVGTTLSVFSGSLDLDLSPGMVGIRDIQLSLEIPPTSEQIAIHCPQYSRTITEQTWWLSFRAGHLADASHANPNVYAIHGWDTPLTGSVLNRTYDTQHGSLQEVSLVTLKHTPR